MRPGDDGALPPTAAVLPAMAHPVPEAIDGGNGGGSSAPTDAVRSMATSPLTERVREELARSIQAGVFASGWLPAEPELAEKLSVSRATLRSALRSLEEEGVISRQRGRGTRINSHVSLGLSLTRVTGFYDLIRESGATPSIDMTTITTAPAEAVTQERLKCDDGTTLVVIGRRFLADGHPAVYLHEMVLADAFRRVVEPRSLPPTIFELAEQFCEWPVDHTVMEIQTAATDERTSDLLAVPIGHPYLRLMETHYSSEGTPFIVSDIAVLDRYIHFIVVRRTIAR